MPVRPLPSRNKVTVTIIPENGTYTMSNWWEVIPGVVPLLQTTAWILLILAAALRFKHSFNSLLMAVEDRIRHGSPVKIGPSGFELGALAKLTEIKPSSEANPPIEAWTDLDLFSAKRDPAKLVAPADWDAVRQDVYRQNDNLFLAHIVLPTGRRDSRTNLPIYDIAIKVVG